MTSKVAIFNEALTMLGAAGISLETEPRGRDLERVYASVVDATLAAHPWRFATSRTTAAALSETPEFGWDYQYELPADPYCLRVLEIADDYTTDFVTEGRRILTNEAGPLKIKFIGRVTDVNLFSAQFVEALATKLAAKCAKKITGSVTLGAQLNNAFDNLIAEAATTASQEGGPRDALTDGDSEFIQARN